MELILAGLFVFVMRLIDMSLDTLRLLFMMRGRKLLSGLIGATQAAVFILAVSQVLSGPLNPWTVAGYSLGFGFGVIVGMIAEERMAMGYAMFRVYSQRQGADIAEVLRAAGHAATLFTGQGKEGEVSVINCAVARREVAKVRALIIRVDPQAFITLDEVRPLQSGYFRH